MDITLYALDGALAQCWRAGIESRKMDGLRVLEGDILEGRADAIVSPANSFWRLWPCPAWARAAVVWLRMWPPAPCWTAFGMP